MRNVKKKHEKGAFLVISKKSKFIEKNVFSRKNCCGAFCGVLLCFPVIYVYVPFFGPVPKTFVGTGWIHGVKKIKKTETLPNIFFVRARC